MLSGYDEGVISSHLQHDICLVTFPFSVSQDPYGGTCQGTPSGQVQLSHVETRPGSPSIVVTE